MLKSEIQDAVDFEVALTKIVLQRSWAHEYTSLSIAPGKSGATVSGVMKLTDKWLESDDRVALTNDIRHQIAHFISGISNEHNFNWQFIANKLHVKSKLIKLKAKEVKECELCGAFTVLVKAQRCYQCKIIEEAVKSNPDVAALVLELIGEL